LKVFGKKPSKKERRRWVEGKMRKINWKKHNNMIRYAIAFLILSIIGEIIITVYFLNRMDWNLTYGLATLDIGVVTIIILSSFIYIDLRMIKENEQMGYC
jgi:hypothetical protein